MFDFQRLRQALFKSRYLAVLQFGHARQILRAPRRI